MSIGGMAEPSIMRSDGRLSAHRHDRTFAVGYGPRSPDLRWPQAALAMHQLPRIAADLAPRRPTSVIIDRDSTGGLAWPAERRLFAAGLTDDRQSNGVQIIQL